jgi:tRNA nucleotidyltransferase (CCA-adding enzyme)
MTSLERKAEKICREVLRRVTPSVEEKEETLRFVETLSRRLRLELENLGLEAEVRVEGSIAKDTWLAGEKDIDLFILIPKEYGRRGFVKVLEAAKRASGGNYLEAYAEHPYIQAEISGFTVDFVPCFKLKRAEEAISSVDRTPFHTAYVNQHLSSAGRSEVRLLKRFMHGIEAYGAEIKIGGFSGYLCEILIMYYGSFLNVLRASSDWCEKEFIDLEGYYRGQEEKAQRIFDQPLIVIDPVDKGRNVASAVRRERLAEFIAASRLFLEDPGITFFFPPETEAAHAEEALRAMHSRGTSFVFLKIGSVRAVPDVLWGQLYKSQRALNNLLLRYGFKILRDAVWSDEKSSSVFIFELQSRLLPAVERHLGPPVTKKKDCEKFLEKHLSSGLLISGPRIEGDRWIVERQRRYRDAAALLRDSLKDGGRRIGVATLISEAFKSSLEILVDDGIEEFYEKNPEFASFFADYLRGRPRWLQ